MFNFLTANPEVPAGMGMRSIIMLVVMFGVMYFLMIRPENKRKKEAEAMRSALKVGDKITTIGGIIGKVVDIKEDQFVIETGADQVRIEFAKWALSTNATQQEAQAAAEKKGKKAEKVEAPVEEAPAVEEVAEAEEK